MDHLTDEQLDAILALHDRRRRNIFRFNDRRINENDRRAIARWFPERKLNDETVE